MSTRRPPPFYGQLFYRHADPEVHVRLKGFPRQVTVVDERQLQSLCAYSLASGSMNPLVSGPVMLIGAGVRMRTSSFTSLGV